MVFDGMNYSQRFADFAIWLGHYFLAELKWYARMRALVVLPVPMNRDADFSVENESIHAAAAENAMNS